MPGEINALSMALTFVLLLANMMFAVSGQYVYNPNRGSSSPIVSAPVADDTNQYVFNVEAPHRVGHTVQALSGISSGHLQQKGCLHPTPAPVYGPPAVPLSKLSDQTGDFLVFVPAFPSSSLVSEVDQVGAAPAPGGDANGAAFVPPDGALFAPPAPLINGTPLPSPRHPTKVERPRYYRR